MKKPIMFSTIKGDFCAKSIIFPLSHFQHKFFRVLVAIQKKRISKEGKTIMFKRKIFIVNVIVK